MRVVVMGCGRVGASVADGLSRIGHEVAIIDRDSAAFNRLSPQFAGERVLGQGFDRDVLLRAGIQGADAFAAVSSGDNSNIISARLARETFGVPRVVARIYDAKRAEVYATRHPHHCHRSLDHRSAAQRANAGHRNRQVARSYRYRRGRRGRLTRRLGGPPGDRS